MVTDARRKLLLLCLAAPALPVCAPDADAATRQIKISANFVYVSSSSESNCTWGIGIRFPTVRGAESYLVKYYDGYYKRLITTSLTPQQATSDPSAPKGTGFAGVTGGGYSPPCSTEAGDPTEGGRFSKGATAYAVFKKPVYKVTGTVRRKCVTRCSLRAQLAGVTISATRKGGGRASAVTGSDGKYQLAIPRKGDWTFAARGLGLRYKPRSRKLAIRADRTGVDFSGCGAAASTSAFGGVPARAAALTPGTQSNKLNKVADGCFGYHTFFAKVEANGSVTTSWSVDAIGKPNFSYELEDLKNASPGSFSLKAKSGNASLTLVIADPPTTFTVLGAEFTRRVSGETVTVRVPGSVVLTPSGAAPAS